MSETYSIPEEVLNGPALAPPPGQVPDFDNPWNFDAVAYLTYAICLFVTTVIVIVRAYAKLSDKKRIELEDVLALVGMGTFYASVWCGYRIASTVGVFTHQWNIRLKDASSVFYIHHIGFNVCVATLGIGKSIIVIEWSRIFVPRGTRNSFYWICKIVLTFTCLSHIAYIVAENLSCFPYQKIWDKTIMDGYCIESQIFQVPGIIIPPVLDAVILVLPQRAIWNLKMTTKKKIGVSLLFLVGLLALGSSIARADKMFEFLASDDKTYTISSVYLWTLAEMTCYFLAFCAPWAPRAFANRVLIYRSFTSFMSHMGISRKSDTKTKTRSWPSKQTSATGNRWDAGRIYQRIRDPAMPLVKYPSNPSINGQEDDPDIPRGGILMTTEITIATDCVDEDVVGREYPWTASRIQREKNGASPH